MIQLVINATLETLLMVLISSVMGVIGGVPMGVFLFSTGKEGLYRNKLLNLLVGFIVNSIRSTPYIILIVAFIPLTRLIVGTSIGTLAAAVPLSIAAIMLYCRIVEDALRHVPKGLIEAALSMGASKRQIITKILIPEALPKMIAGLTLVIISLVGFSAMAGAAGGGGLGDLGIRYGYQRYNLPIIITVVSILIVMVHTIQIVGDQWAKKLRK